jgi:hypothetical protein
MARNASPIRIARLASLSLSCALATACATRLPPPGLDFAGAAIAADPTAPALSIDGLPGGKAGGAGVGAATGVGTGVVAGSMACLATGPFFPLCIATVVPASMAIGGVTGAVVGAVRSESADARIVRRDMLAAELASTPYPSLLAEQIRRQAQADYATSLMSPMPEGEVVQPVPPAVPALRVPVADSPGAAARPLRIEVSIPEVGSEGKSEFALRVVVRIKVYRPGETSPVYDTAREVQSETELTNDAWSAEGGQALRGILGRCVEQAARQVLVDLLPSAAGARGGARASIGGKYSTSCRDAPADARPPAPVT